MHYATGMSPYFLIFGCEHKVPVDFLLNNQVEETAETPEQWIESKLQAAYGEVQERLRGKKVAHHKRCYKGRRNDQGFRKGELVYLKNHHCGQNKIQDLYDSCLCKVVLDPGEQGAVYSVAPVSQAGSVKQVHWMELCKALIDSVLRDVDSTVFDEAVNFNSESTTDSDSDSASCVLLQGDCVSPPTMVEHSALEISSVAEAQPLGLRHSGRTIAGHTQIQINYTGL